MKKIFSILILAATLFNIGCFSEYDDSAVWDELKKHNERISKLETLCSQMNTNISSLQTIVTALQANDYITSVAPITQNGVEIGYTITFAKNGSITIYHGKDGKDGADGQNGKDGINGTDGKDGVNGTDGSTPIIGVKKDSDGVYYWTVNGEWLLDDAGNKVKAVGTDGKDGANGKDGVDGTNGTDGKDGVNGTNGTNGTDGITPQLKIENDYWYVSYDNGASWTELGLATSEESDSCIIKDITETESAVIFTIADGSTITISKSGSSTPNDDIIQFVDQNAKLLCISYFDTDNDGELSYAEAAAVTELDEFLFEECPIIMFNEFKHFTSITEIPRSCFTESWCLSQITLPEQITSIGRCAFYETILSSLTIPRKVTTIGDYALASVRIKYLYCKPTTPPVIIEEDGEYSSDELFGACIPTIYVPAESVEAYKKANFWREYADKIIGYDFE